MKTILTALMLACLTFSASAQLVPGALHNQLNYLKKTPLTIDTNLSKLTLPIAPGTNYNLFKLPQTLTGPIAGMTDISNALVVYSRMPVKGMLSTDKMPIAHMGDLGSYAGVKRVLVIDPLAGRK